MKKPLFEKNLLAFEQNQKNRDLIDSSVAYLKATSASQIESYAWWIDQNDYPKAIVFPQLMPRNEIAANNLRSMASLGCIDGTIQDLIDLHADTQLPYLLNKLASIVLDCGFDLQDNLSLANADRLNQLVCLGTGNGNLIKELIQRLRPTHINIIVTSWNDLASSFFEVDWAQLTNEISSWNGKLHISRVEDNYHLLHTVVQFGITVAEHSYVYISSQADSKLRQLSSMLYGQEKDNMYHYLGYTNDEINMIINSVDTICKGPRLFSSPTKPLGFKAIVCGSGPSLDENLDHIKSLEDTHVVIAGGSNYRTLALAGIRVDYLVLVERAFLVYEDYRETVDKVGKTKTRLVMSSTCVNSLMDLFDETCIYYRPALSPVALFSESKRDILNFEGPESANAALAFACALGAEDIVLVGVDLGSVAQSLKRSANAAGPSERIWDRTHQGNFREVVWTNRAQVDSKLVMETCIRSFPNINFWNSSDGVMIEGCHPIRLEMYSENIISEVKNANKTSGSHIVGQWWNNLKSVDGNYCRACLISARPREKTFKLTAAVSDLLRDSSLHFASQVAPELENLMSLSVPLHDQFPRRIMRSTIIKSLIAIIQQLHIMEKTPNQKSVFEAQAKAALLDVVESMESKIYQLCDYVDEACLKSI